MFEIYLIILAVMSILTIIVFAIDKKLSKKESNARIPEIVLLSLMSFGGAVGGIIGINVLRHKTNPITKFHFAVTAILSAAVQIVLLVMML